MTMTAEKRESILKKIKLLLRKRSSDHQAEVEAAMAKAQELANRYQIDLADVDPDAEEFEVNESILHSSIRLQNEVKYAGMIVKEYFNVSTYILDGWKKKEYRIVGTGVDRELAQYVFDFLVGSFRRLWNEALRAGRHRIQDRHVFMAGLHMGVVTRLREEKSKLVTERGLMVIGNKLAQRKRYMTEKHPDLKKGKPMNLNDGSGAAYNEGYDKGRQLNIRRGVKAPTTQPKKGELKA